MEGFEDIGSHNYNAAQMVASLEHNVDNDNRENNKEVIKNLGLFYFDCCSYQCNHNFYHFIA